MQDQIIRTVKQYILSEFLPGEEEKELTESTPLIMGGILDSIGVIKVITFLEEKYSVEFRPDEVVAEHLNTISDIATLIGRKLKEHQQ